MAATLRSARKHLAVAAAVPAAVLASGALVLGASYSAFSATTANPTSSWDAGTVALSDDDNGTAMFTATNLKPGATGEKCIKVSSTGSLASAVKLYATSYTTTNGLAGQIDLSVEEGAGGTFGSCTGFTASSTAFSGTLADFGAKTTYAAGVGAWTPAAASTASPATHVYRVTYTLRTNAANTAQGGTAAVGLTWEAQNS